MKRVPQQFFFAIGVRSIACGVVALLLLRTGAFTRPADGLGLFLLGYSVVYTVCWAWLLRRWWTRMRDGSLLLLYDLVLSVLPVWASGGWNSAFLPVALGALVVPALGVRWRTGLVAAAIFTVLDQTILWTATRTPWQIAEQGQAPLLLGRTLLPYGVVLAITGAARVWQRTQRRTARRRAAPRALGSSVPLRPNMSSYGERSAGYERGGGNPQPTQTINAVAAHPPATIRRTSTSIQGTLRQLRSELDAAGVSLTTRLQGDDQCMPPQINMLVLRTLEVAVDNVLAHAHAKAVTIALQINPADAVLDVIDDGIGLWDGTAEPPGFHQIKRLRYRAEELGGALSVTERVEGGVALQLRVPFK
jgi:glucose-6-phosphate-specific signal transduction histidine kinase